MGQALDRDGRVLGEASGETKREVFDELQRRHPDAHEVRMRTLGDEKEQPPKPRGITKDNLLATMSYHTLDESQQAAYGRIQDAAVAFATVLLEVLPPCGDQQAAIRHIFEAKATANRGVAIKGLV